jgi:transposase
MGERTVVQEALFYDFSLERHVPAEHMLRSIDRLVDLSGIRAHLRPFYSEIGRPSIDPDLMIRMLLIGYCFGIRSERRLCEEVHLNLAYRWFCRLGLEGDVMSWFAGRKKELANRPLIREQAFGEALDPYKLERLGRYEVHLDRTLERTLIMLLRLKDLRQGAVAS